MACALRDNQELLSETHIPEFLEKVPVQALRFKTRNELTLHLNVEMASGNDWRYLADLVGARMVEIHNMERKANPADAVLTFAMQKDINIKQILEFILEIGRPDVITACADMIFKDAREYIERPIQDGEITSEFKPLTFEELETGQKEYFDAFLSYHPQDINFVQELLTRLEDEEKFKLCVKERDVIIGLANSNGITDLIEKRSKRMIVILSNSYVNSAEDNMFSWVLDFGLALAPSGRKINKIIPIVIEEGVKIPSVLRPFNVSDYTNPATRQWFWDRIRRSLKAPTNNHGGYEGPDGPLRRRPECHRAGNSDDRSQPPSYTSRESIPPSGGHIVRNRSQTEDLRLSSSSSDFDLCADIRVDRSESNLELSSSLESNSTFYVPKPPNPKRRLLDILFRKNKPNL